MLTVSSWAHFKSSLLFTVKLSHSPVFPLSLCLMQMTVVDSLAITNSKQIDCSTSNLGDFCLFPQFSQKVHQDRICTSHWGRTQPLTRCSTQRSLLCLATHGLLNPHPGVYLIWCLTATQSRDSSFFWPVENQRECSLYVKAKLFRQ